MKWNPDCHAQGSSTRFTGPCTITDRAQSLMPLLHQLMDWAYHNLHDIVTDREKYYTNIVPMTTPS